MPEKIDRNKWSNSSRRSSEYTGQFKNDDFYLESIGYRCRKCHLACSFTPHEQKHAYEVDKKILHYVPSLCPKCHEAYETLNSQLKNYQNIWNSNREQLKSDSAFIKQWLDAVREKKSYGKQSDLTRERMLVKLLHQLQNELSST